MYTEFYGLAKKPFNMTPDPAFLFLTKQHREALAGLTYAILDRKGFLVLSGMAGSGKTTLLAWVLQKLPVEQVQSSVILNPTLTRDEFLELAMLDFGIADVPPSKAQRLWKLQSFLLKGKQEGKVSVLIVDEAHKLTFELLEEIRLLGNLEYGEEKLIQIVLIGQSELDEVLSRADLWQLKQRISVRLAIQPLSVHEVDHYIQHRWSVAGGQSAPPFSPEAIAHVGKWSRCIPRLINSICDNALMLAFAEESHMVTPAHVDVAAKDLLLTPKIVKPAAAGQKLEARGEKPEARSEKPPEVSAAPTSAVPVNGSSGAHAAASAPPPPAMKTLAAFEPPPRKRSMIGRLAEKLGLSSGA